MADHRSSLFVIFFLNSFIGIHFNKSLRGWVSFGGEFETESREKTNEEKKNKPLFFFIESFISLHKLRISGSNKLSSEKVSKAEKSHCGVSCIVFSCY